MKRIEKPLYYAALVAATGMTAWFGGAFALWMIRQFTIIE